MKAKEKKVLEAMIRERKAVNKAVDALDKLDRMLAQGIKVMQGGRGFVSVREVRAVAMDQLHAIAVQVYGSGRYSQAA